MQAALEEKLLRTVDFWCNKVTQGNTVVAWDHELEQSIEVQNLFYPEKDDLISAVWIKILTPETLQRLETIWRTQGSRAIDKFASVIVTNAFRDCLRYSEVRESEILAVSLDQEISSASDDGSEEVSTLGDFLLSDESYGYQTFSLDDLRAVLSAEELDLLKRSCVDGYNVREIASQSGVSKSEVARTLSKAKQKTRKWLSLPRIYPATVSRAPLRPDRLYLQKEECEAWKNLSFPIVPEHDPIAEWDEAYYAHLKKGRRQKNLKGKAAAQKKWAAVSFLAPKTAAQPAMELSI